MSDDASSLPAWRRKQWRTAPRARKPRPHVAGEDWREGLNGTEMEQAILWAVNGGGLQNIQWVLLDPSYEMDMQDRKALADFIMKRLVRPAHRPAKDTTPAALLKDIPVAQQAANYMKHLRQQRKLAGERSRGTLQLDLEQAARRFGITVDQVMNAHRRSTR